MSDANQNDLGVDQISAARADEVNTARMNAALASDVPYIYANGFLNSQTPGDVLTILERNGKPVCVLNMSYTTAKSYAVYLGQLIANLEQKSGREIMISDEVLRFSFPGFEDSER